MLASILAVSSARTVTPSSASMRGVDGSASAIVKSINASAELLTLFCATTPPKLRPSGSPNHTDDALSTSLFTLEVRLAPAFALTASAPLAITVLLRKKATAFEPPSAA
jgi:hypothetical protein